LRQTRFYQEVIQEGIQQGITQGIQQEASSLTLRQLQRKVGEVPMVLQSQIRSLPVEQLEELGEALLDFGSLRDLTAWLETVS
jgi:predicted transposase YdaD